VLKIITHDRISRDGLAALRDVVLAAETPVLYLTGAGEAFCAGAGLDTVESLSRPTAVEFGRLIARRNSGDGENGEESDRTCHGETSGDVTTDRDGN
jgi:enoyl-CoA hydratase/carnithine racemase